MTPGADKAGNAILPLAISYQGQPAVSEQACTPGKDFCVELVYQQDDAPPRLNLLRLRGKDSDARFELADLKTEAMPSRLALWPRLLALGDAAQGVLVGVEENANAMYSGGGASASILRLLRVYPDGKGLALREALSLPVYGSALIRACFSDRDYRQRRGACHDEYEFSSRISLDKQVSSGFPRLVYQTRATSFPGHVSRTSDSLARGQLKKRDIVTVLDPACSFHRTLRFDAAAGVYAPDKPLPDCDQYLVP
ncbi:hypothetical protein CEK28_06170 [Xenophilus sp. AP218F]|nr:hypothetical protein CEK28_06170 [Xenophilus sp. AP218F]